MSSTRDDWLLDKLLKMKQSLTEVVVENKGLKAALELVPTQVQSALRVAESRYQERIGELEEREEDLTQRIRELSPEKQFEVIYRGGGRYARGYAITSVASANGKTTITIGGFGYPLNEVDAILP